MQSASVLGFSEAVRELRNLNAPTQQSLLMEVPHMFLKSNLVNKVYK